MDENTGLSSGKLNRRSAGVGGESELTFGHSSRQRRSLSAPFPDIEGGDKSLTRSDFIATATATSPDAWPLFEAQTHKVYKVPYGPDENRFPSITAWLRAKKAR